MTPGRVNAPVVTTLSKRLCERAFGPRGNGSAIIPIPATQMPTANRICFAHLI